MDNTLTRTVDLTGTPAGTPARLDARVWYDIEQDFDYLTVEASTDGGSGWTALPGTVDSAPTGPKGITGTSAGWTRLSVPLDRFAGGPVQLRLRVTSDSNTHGKGVAFDDIRITAGDVTAGDVTELLRDGAEQGANGWSAVKWSRTQGRTGSEQHPRAYFVENRRHTGYGSMLKTGPYNFGFTGDKVEFFPYQEGVLVWLWNTAQSDNTTKAHPGEGLLLPVDARPEPLTYADGTLLNARAQTFDATFSLGRSDRIVLHKAGAPTVIPARPGVPVFDDRRGTYWDARLPQLGVKVPDTGTRIAVAKEASGGAVTTVQVSPSK